MNQNSAYELFEELGRGANTVVYRGYDLTLGREVAIKELNETARRDPRHRERFLREAQFLAQFEHDNVLRVYSVDTERGWIIMELMKGTLASIIAGGSSSPDLVRSILKQTLEALAFLHEKQKVHGTVRPTNLLINEAGRVKLSEFEETAAGGELRAPTGSKKYLAPELIRPEFGDFGPPLDLYCLGFTALELLKGPQFEGLFPGTGKGAIDADIAWLRWHSSADELATTRKLVRGIPDDLAQVLDRMLKKRVADRPQTAQEVLKELADRPLIAVPVADLQDEERPSELNRLAMAPAVVRTLAAPEAAAPRPTAAIVDSSSSDRPAASTKSSTSAARRKPVAAGKAAAPRFSKDWWNQQLGRPYVLYPLCAAILLGALWFTISINSDSSSEAAALIAVRFDVKPDASGLQISNGEEPLKSTEEGAYQLAPGRHAVTFRKEGFEALTREFDVSAENKRFDVELKPIIKFRDVAIQVTPADAELNIGGSAQTFDGGTATHRLQEGQPLEVDAKRSGYVALARSFSPTELAELDYKIVIELEREKPRLPASLVAKPGAEIDPATQMPVRVLAAKFAAPEAMELALVKPGTYQFGAAQNEVRANEQPGRSVQIEQPFYIAIHETTNAQYQRFFEEAGESPAGERWQRASRKWAARLELHATNNNLPVTNVSIEEAQAFCEWLGARLPTEIEWESAVRGLQDRGYPYPWGTAEPSRERCQIFRGQLGTVTVDQLAAGASPLGLMHAIGNAAEWCQDSEQPGQFILRGCSFATANIKDVRVTWRRRGESRGEEDTGFRVVVPIADPQPKLATAPVSRISTAGGAGVLAPLHILPHLPWQSFARELGLSN